MFVDRIRILPETGQIENSQKESLILEMKHLGFPEKRQFRPEPLLAG